VARNAVSAERIEKEDVRKKVREGAAVTWPVGQMRCSPCWT